MAEARSESGPPTGNWEPGAGDISSLWKAMSSEPGTGVTVLTFDGRILFANDHIARMVFGPDAVGRNYAGKRLAELFPPEWVDERLTLLSKVIRTGEPVVTRTVWRGDQLLSWMHRVDGEGAEAADDGSQGPAAPDRVLVVTRRAAGEEDLKRIGLTGVEVFESGVLRLGPLDVLTPRELEVLALLGQGLSLQEIAKVLFRSHKTVSRHRDAIGRKLMLGDRIKLAELAWKAGLTVRDAERQRV